jgi:hypothetical protein
MPLNTKAARIDLTDRECTKLLGALIGGLAQMTDIDTLRNAVRWWADTDVAWQAMDGFTKGITDVIRRTSQ